MSPVVFFLTATGSTIFPLAVAQQISIRLAIHKISIWSPSLAVV
jgi:hypothetical protein